MNYSEYESALREAGANISFGGTVCTDGSGIRIIGVDLADGTDKSVVVEFNMDGDKIVGINVAPSAKGTIGRVFEPTDSLSTG